MSSSPRPATDTPAGIPRPPDRITRVLVVAFAAAGALFSVAFYRNTQAQVEELVAAARDAGLGPKLTETERRLARESNGARAETILAHTLLSVELDAGRVYALGPADLALEAGRGADRRELAGRLARAALAREPASWEAPLVLGAIAFLDLTAARDTRLFERPELWSAPLELARRRAPAFSEPSQLLAAVNLELWPALGRGARDHARVILREAFRDLQTFDRLFAAWSAIARNRRELYDPLPDRPEVWERVLGFHAAQSDWAGYLDAESRWQRSQHDTLAETLAEARRRLAGGDAAGARTAYVELARRSRPSLAAAPLYTNALTERPAGAVGDALGASARRWLHWAEALCLVRECPLPREAFARLAGGVIGNDAELQAFAYLESGDLPAAELVERRTEAQWSEAWAPFLLLKAERLTAARDFESAATTLAAVHRNWRGRLPLAIARRRLAAAGYAGLSLAQAEEALARFQRSTWEPVDWLWQGPTVRLELFPSRHAAGLELELEQVPARGAIVALQWNGEPLALRVIPAGERRLELDLEVAPEPALLSFEAVAGGQVRPGRVELR